MPKCKNCQQPFTITDEDRQFYNKIDVSEPTWCPDCRMQRRLAFRNPQVFYPRQCDLCKKNMISVYSPGNKFPIYCNDCWWSDKWDAKSYGRDFDFSRPFFEQFAELLLAVPRQTLLASKNINSDYTVHSGNNKNCYLSGVIFNSEDCYYSQWLFNAKDCVDSLMLYENCELCYQCIWCFQCFNCFFCFSCKGCNNLKFCFDCIGCHDCFMSSNLRNQCYIFRNKQLSEEEYNKKMEEVNLASWQEVIRLEKDFKELKNQSIHKFAEITKSTNCTGDYLINDKDSFNCFLGVNSEDLKNCYGCEGAKDCVDSCGFGLPIGSELLYEIHGVGTGYNSRFINMTYNVSDSEYTSFSHNLEDCFGCVGLAGGQHCILNKQYSEEEYKKLVPQIIEQMRKNGEYGEFFPVSLSPFGYNETTAMEFYPLAKEEAIARGFNWQDNLPMTTGQETMESEEIPDNIKDAKDDITKEILVCNQCQRNYKIIPQELKFYREQGLSLPRHCPSCRHLERIRACSMRELHHRQCMCENTEHGHSGRCSEEFETTYAPDRPERVYCEDCYRKEIY